MGQKLIFLYFDTAGGKGLVLSAHFGYKSDRQSEFQTEDLMAREKESSEVNRNPYPPIEPYSNGFLKVSDIHTIYWEQSGNPAGHVSIFYHTTTFEFSQF